MKSFFKTLSLYLLILICMPVIIPMIWIKFDSVIPFCIKLDNLVEWLFSRKLYKKKIIYRHDKDPYMIRYTLLTCKWFSIKIHKILLSDYDCHHDHPWSFITFILKGGYVEHRTKWVRISDMPNGSIYQKHIIDLEGERVGLQSSRLYSRWSLLYRTAEYTHQLEIHQPVWTFVITFKKVRQWGFWTKLSGWLHWKDYSQSNSCE